MKKIALISLMIFVTACTYSVNLIHTEGSASDVVDEDQKADADLQATVPLQSL
jgi:hypothetical protein